MEVHPYNLCFRDNQEGEEVTVVDQLHIIGTLLLYLLQSLGPCLDWRFTWHVPYSIPGEPHTERHVGAQGRFLSVPEEFTLS